MVDVVVVFAFRFNPNWLVPRTPVAGELMAGIVLEPDVSVGPATVILYPKVAFVDAAICDVAVAVSVGEKSWLKLTVPLVAVLQSGIPAVVLTVAPVQKMSDSGIVPVRTMGLAVLAATVPLSVEPVVAVVDVKVVIRTKKAWFGVVGLVIVCKR
jgi:hypothetical protein